MTQYLPFHLPEEILRLNNASPFDAFILKSKIDEFLDATQIKSTVKDRISYGSKLKYFDTDKMDIDVLFVENIEENTASGTRLSDDKKVTAPLESLSLLNPVDADFEERIELDRYTSDQREPLTKVAVEQRNYRKTYVEGRILLLGYLIRSNTYTTCKIRLLGGDLVTLSRYRLYHPTTYELELFDKAERDPYLIEKEWQRTKALAKECLPEMDVGLRQSANKLTRYLITRGCTPENIEKIININRRTNNSNDIYEKLFV